MKFQGITYLRNISLLLIFSGIIFVNFLWAFRSDELRDFGSFMASGRAAAEGLNPYAYDYPLVFTAKLKKLGMIVTSPNLNPPISIPILGAVSSFDPHKLLLGWRILSIICYGLAIVILLKAFPTYSNFVRIFWLFTIGGFWHIIELGQIQTFILLCGAGAWIFLKKNNCLYAGILIGLIVAIKPNFAVWLLFLFLGNFKKEAFSALAVAIVLSVLPMILYGTEIYYQWFEAVKHFNGLAMVGNSSLVGLTARLGLPLAGELLGIMLISALGVCIWRHTFSALEISALAIVVALLASPIAWGTYMVMLIPLFIERQWNKMLIISAAILSVPFVFIINFSQVSHLNFVIIGWFYGWSLLLILIALLNELKIIPGSAVWVR